MLLARQPHQHHRHAGPRRLHRRGGAFAARARRRHRAVRLGGRRRAPVRDRLAPGRQVPRPAHRLHQQDGPHRGRLRSRRPDHDRPPRRPPGPDPASDRRGGRLPRDHRPRRQHGDHLQGRARDRVRDHRHPGRVRRRGRRRPRAPARGGLPLRRRAARDDPRGAGDPHRAPQGRDPQGHARDQDDPGPVRVVVQEQGRSAAAGRRHRLLAQPARGSARGGHRAGQGRGGGPARPAQAGRLRALRGPGLQDRRRPLRRQAHLLPRLLGQARGGRARAQRLDRPHRADRAHPDDARQPPRGGPGGLRR